MNQAKARENQQDINIIRGTALLQLITDAARIIIVVKKAVNVYDMFYSYYGRCIYIAAIYDRLLLIVIIYY